MSYCIHEKYKERLNNEEFDDTANTDNFQLEVYKYASDLFRETCCCSVVDVGCGSGHKLTTYFGNYNHIGVETNQKTLEFLRKTYPNDMWVDYSKSILSHRDMVICSDVIEHVKDPDELLTYIASFTPKVIVLSTPDRDMLFNHNGPPGNRAHVREWSYREFEQYISQFFKVCEHFISNKEQCTQVIVATPLTK